MTKSENLPMPSGLYTVNFILPIYKLYHFYLQVLNTQYTSVWITHLGTFSIPKGPDSSSRQNPSDNHCTFSAKLLTTPYNIIHFHQRVRFISDKRKGSSQYIITVYTLVAALSGPFLSDHYFTCYQLKDFPYCSTSGTPIRYKGKIVTAKPA